MKSATEPFIGRLRVIDPSCHQRQKANHECRWRVTYSAVLMRSVGVTATTLSTHPATIPANIPRPGERDPFSSTNRFLIESKERNRTPALNVVPFIKTLARAPIPRAFEVTYEDECRTARVNRAKTMFPHNTSHEGQWVFRSHVTQLRSRFCELKWILPLDMLVLHVRSSLRLVLADAP